jgi:hypothetical protein
MNDEELRHVAAELGRAAEDARPGGDCPPAERIWEAVTLALPRGERLAILDHTTECPACAEAWRIAMTLREGAAVGARPLRRVSWAAMLTGARAAAILLAITGAGIWYWATGGVDQQGARQARQPDVPSADVRSTPSAPVVMTVVDGGSRIELSQDGTLAAPLTWSAPDRARVGELLRSRTVATPAQLEDLRVTSGVLMGGERARMFGLAVPVATMVDSDRPTFSWVPLPGALDYEVTIWDVAANHQEVVSSPQLSETSWRVTRRLTRGRTYSWQVVARTPDGDVKAPAASEGEVRFQVISLDTANALARARETHPQDHLLLGVRYAEAGLMDEAEAEFRIVARANPKLGWLPLLLRVRRLGGESALRSPQ